MSQFSTDATGALTETGWQDYLAALHDSVSDGIQVRHAADPCECGNTPEWAGFTTVGLTDKATFEEVEPVVGCDWDRLYQCNDCETVHRVHGTY